MSEPDKVPQDSGSVGRCPACAEPVAADAPRCPWCGAERTPGAPRAAPFAWDDRSQKLLKRWWTTWKASHFKMEEFFRTLPPQGGHGSPLRYFVLNELITLVPNLFCMGLYFGFIGVASRGQRGGDEMMMGMTIVMAVWALLAIPLAILGLYIAAGLHHLCAKMLGAQGPFERTFRVLCFSSGALIWSLIPSIGALATLGFMIVMEIFGYRHQHGLTTGKAVAAALIPPIASILFCCGGYILLLVSVFALR